MVDLRQFEDQDSIDSFYEPTPERLALERNRYLREPDYRDMGYDESTTLDRLPIWALEQKFIEQAQTNAWKKRIRDREAERQEKFLESFSSTGLGRTVAHGIMQGTNKLRGTIGSVAGSFIPDELGGRKIQEMGRRGDAQDAYQQSFKKMADEGDLIETEWLRTTAHGISQTLPSIAAGGMQAAPIIGVAVTNELVSAREKGKKAGLKGDELNWYAGRSALIEGGVTAAFQMAGLGGIEGAFAKNATATGIKQFVTQAGSELAEENIIAGLQAVNDQLSRVDRNALDYDKLVKTFRDASLQSVGMMGMVHGTKAAPNMAESGTEFLKRMAGGVRAKVDDASGLGEVGQSLESTGNPLAQLRGQKWGRKEFEALTGRGDLSRKQMKEAVEAPERPPWMKPRVETPVETQNPENTGKEPEVSSTVETSVETPSGPVITETSPQNPDKFSPELTGEFTAEHGGRKLTARETRRRNEWDVFDESGKRVAEGLLRHDAEQKVRELLEGAGINRNSGAGIPALEGQQETEKPQQKSFFGNANENYHELSMGALRKRVKQYGIKPEGRKKSDMIRALSDTDNRIAELADRYGVDAKELRRTVEEDTEAQGYDTEMWEDLSRRLKVRTMKQFDAKEDVDAVTRADEEVQEWSGQFGQRMDSNEAWQGLRDYLMRKEGKAELFSDEALSRAADVLLSRKKPAETDPATDEFMDDDISFDFGQNRKSGGGMIAGMGKAIGENLRDRMWNDYQAGKSIEPVVNRAISEAPGMTREQFISWVENPPRQSMGAAAAFPPGKPVTQQDVDTRLGDIETASKLAKPKFEKWVKDNLGFPPSGTKAQMKKQALDFVKRLAVTDTQVRDHNTAEENAAMDDAVRKSAGAEGVQGEAWGVGRPELANPGKTEQQRETVDELDELRKLKEKPERKGDDVTTSEADKITDAQARKALAEKDMLSDAETIAARRALRKQLDKSLKGEDFAETIKMFDQWRNSGTEQARAFRQRIDTEETPAQRNLRILGEAIFTPSKKARGDNDAMLKEFEKIRKELERLGFELEKLEEIAKDPTATAKVLGAVKPIKAKFSDKVYEYWRNAILSAPTTHIVNTVGNVANTTWHMTGQRFAEAVVNSVVRDPKSAQWGEFKHLLRGGLRARSRAARNFLATWSTERSQFEVDIGKRHDPEGGVPVHETGDVAIGGKKGKIIRIPQRLLAAADDFMKTLIANAEVEAQAYRIAKQEGKKGDELAQRIEELTMDINSDAWHTAVDVAHELTFQSDVGPRIRSLMAFRSNTPGFRYLVPFITTPVNLFKLGVKMSPLGSAQPVINKLATGKWGITPTMLAQQAIAWAVLYALMSNDPDDPWITGAEAEIDPKERGLARRSFPPMSIKIGGTWYSYSRIEPFATATALTVDTLNGMKSSDESKSVTSPMKSLIGQAKSKTFLTGLSDFMEFINKPGDNGPKWAANFTTSWIPNVVRSTSRSGDETYDERRVWGKGDDWWKRLGKRTLQKTELKLVGDLPKVDLWGRDVPTTSVRSTFLWNLMSPVRAQKHDPFVADRLLVKWNNDHPGDEYRPFAPSPRKGDGTYMDDEEYNRFAKLSGTIARKILEAELLDADNPTEQDIETVKRALQDARRIARENLDADASKVAAEIHQKHIQAKASLLTRRPQPITATLRRQARDEGISPAKLRKRKAEELKAAQEEARKWLKKRGVKFTDIAKAYRPNVAPATRVRHLRAIRSQLRG